MTDVAKQREIARFLADSKIERVEIKTWPDGRGGMVTCPVFHFVDKTMLTLTVTETDGNDYGIELNDDV